MMFLKLNLSWNRLPASVPVSVIRYRDGGYVDCGGLQLIEERGIKRLSVVRERPVGWLRGTC
jgi:hypothetical protein